MNSLPQHIQDYINPNSKFRFFGTGHYYIMKLHSYNRQDEISIAKYPTSFENVLNMYKFYLDAKNPDKRVKVIDYFECDIVKPPQSVLDDIKKVNYNAYLSLIKSKIITVLVSNKDFKLPNKISCEDKYNFNINLSDEELIKYDVFHNEVLKDAHIFKTFLKKQNIIPDWNKDAIIADITKPYYCLTADKKIQEIEYNKFTYYDNWQSFYCVFQNKKSHDPIELNNILNKRYKEILDIDKNKHTKFVSSKADMNKLLYDKLIEICG